MIYRLLLTPGFFDFEIAWSYHLFPPTYYPSTKEQTVGPYFAKPLESIKERD